MGEALWPTVHLPPEADLFSCHQPVSQRPVRAYPQSPRKPIPDKAIVLAERLYNGARVGVRP